MGPGHPGRARLNLPAEVLPSRRTQIAVVGAGAARPGDGYLHTPAQSLAGGRALGRGRWERRKILVSGGSRCNVTNVSVTERDFWGGKPTIVRRVLRGLSAADTVTWFESLGVSLPREEHGKLFPNTNRARDVLDALLREVHASGAVLSPATRIVDVTSTRAGFLLGTATESVEADIVVVLATGRSVAAQDRQ